MYEVSVTADTNDADYVTRIEDATEEDIAKLRQVASIIGSSGHNFGTSDQSNLEDFEEEHHVLLEWFADMYVPREEYGVHTIESIEYYPKQIKISIL